MAWRRPPSAAALLAALSGLAGCGGSGGAGTTATQPPPAPRKTQQWAFVSMGPGARSVRIAYTYGGCDRDPRERVVATARAVRIVVTVAVPSNPRKACIAIARSARPEVRLEAPLAGRRLLGWAGAEQPDPGACRPRRRLPRVVGLAAADARRALAETGLRPTGAASGAVTAQRPAAADCVDAGARVVLSAR